MTTRPARLLRDLLKKPTIALFIGLAPTLLTDEAPAFLTAEDFFRSPNLVRVVISPTGEFFAAEIRNAKAKLTVYHDDRTVSVGSKAILVQHIDSKTTARAVGFTGSIRYLEWIDEDTLIVGSRSANRDSVSAVDIEFVDGEFAFEIDRIRAPGWVVDAIPNREQEVLWAYAKKKETVVYQAPLSELKKFEAEKRKKKQKPWPGLSGNFVVAELGGYVPWWITDRDGVVRGAVGLTTSKQPEVFLWYREAQSQPWRELYRTEDIDDVLIPIGVAKDNYNLIVLSNKGRDTTALVEFSVDSGELGEVFFAHPNADVQDVIYDFNGMEVLTAVYEEAGVRRYHHFDSFSDRFQRSLEHAFPGQSVAITSTSRDSRYFSVFVSNPRNPGAFYILDTENRTAEFVDRTMPWLDQEELSDTQLLDVTSMDGTKVEAFLTIPVGSEEELPPLLVLPHGGPFGVRDSRDFDPLVQYIASWNIAVLQVNFRGSAGYGKSFLEAGYRERAKGIEDDIEAAVDLVVAARLIDRDRMCIAGMSYGGYSALISVIRQPNRYRCAVTVSGVSDLPLQLHSTGMAKSREGRKRLEQLYGDPETEYEQLVAISPAYRAAEIAVPVLIVHGTEDRTVDVEHAYRLKAMLEAHGKPHAWHLLEGAGHAPSRRQWFEVARALTLFVEGYLHPYESDIGEPPGS